MTVPLKAAKVATGGRQVVGPKRRQRMTPALQKAIDEENGRLGLEGAPPPAPESTPAPAPTSSGAGAGGPTLPAMPAAAATGSGVLLGVFAWAVGLAYLQGGSAGVKKFFAAKFFNKT